MKRNSIFKKVLFNNFKIMLIPLILIMLLIGFYACNKYKKEEIQLAQKQVENYAQQVKAKMDIVVSMSEKMQRYSYIVYNLNSDFKSYYEVYDFVNNANIYLDNITSGLGESSLIIYFSNKKLFQSKYFLRIETLENYEELQKQFDAQKISLIYDSHIHENINGEKYFLFYKNMPFSKGSILSGRVYISETPPNVQIIEKNLSEYESRAYVKVGINDLFYVVGAVNYKLIYSRYLETILIVLSISMLLALVLYYSTLKAMDRVTHDINNFIMQLDAENIVKSDLDLQVKTGESREVWVIKKAISSFFGEIKRISDLGYKVELEKKTVELKLLQSQIDPHTMYNSLSAIRFGAFLRKDEDMTFLIDNMVAYYRTVLSKGKTVVLVADEIDMIKKYIVINELSHYKKYNLQVDIDDELLNCQILHLFLQPFVENVLIHGLSGSKTDCVIKISCTSENGYLIFKIYDNGRGINPETLEKLNNLEEYDNGYGVKNVYLRLKLTYEDSSIAYESELNKGTTVTIKFLQQIEPKNIP